jgi:hypothetical protein
VDEPAVTVLTNDSQLTGSVSMSLSASGQQNPLYSLKLTITPATPVSQSTPVEVAFGNVPQPIPGLQNGIVSSAQSGNEYLKVLYPTVTKTGDQWSIPVLQAGQSTLTSGGLGLAAYQYLAGDPPTLLNGTGWI